MNGQTGERQMAPKGHLIKINLGGHVVPAFRALHHSKAGPGLLLISDQAGLDAGIQARANLFGEEGYSVLAIALGGPHSEINKAATVLSQMEGTESGMAIVGHGAGGLAACQAAADGAFNAVVAFDVPELADHPEILEAIPCPFVLQFGTQNSPDAESAANALRTTIKRKDGSRVLDWEEAGPGFAIPERDSFNARADSLAHTRTLELIRRVIGPYYDFVSLFAEHVYHEFTTRDVDATMATMIDEPYVNHVPTLAGGVGHDMLKRFYKYHFVEQNAGGRERTRLSYTMGPDRVVLETFTRFKHDTVIDRYFPGIEPTGKEVEIVTVIIVKFRGDKVCHEHLYWDQGSALKQIGVLDSGDLPLTGPEGARKVLDESLPSNIFMQESWATSEGKPL